MKWSAARSDIKEEGTEERAYTTETERKRCQEAAAAFAELCRDEGIVVLEAGRYCYAKLRQQTDGKLSQKIALYVLFLTIDARYEIFDGFMICL